MVTAATPVIGISFEAPTTVPTLADARRAAAAIADGGAERVYCFGSVARGDAMLLSDIDLLAVFADLDYDKRAAESARLRRLASVACGHAVDVVVTDRAEWRIQTDRVPSSLFARIGPDLAELVNTVGAATLRWEDTTWDKEQVMPTSKYQDAAQRLSNGAKQLRLVRSRLRPTVDEVEAAERGDMAEADSEATLRLVSVCEAAHLAIENFLKAILTAESADPNKWSGEHNIEQLLGYIVATRHPRARGLAAKVSAYPEQVPDLTLITMWRQRGPYSGELNPDPAATPLFVAALADIACDAADDALPWLAEYDVAGDAADAVRYRAGLLRSRLARYDRLSGRFRP